jgi:hypothetical protein
MVRPRNTPTNILDSFSNDDALEVTAAITNARRCLPGEHEGQRHLGQGAELYIAAGERMEWSPRRSSPSAASMRCSSVPRRLNMRRLRKYAFWNKSEQFDFDKDV